MAYNNIRISYRNTVGIITTITTLYGGCIGVFKDMFDIRKNNMNFGIISNAITGAGVGFIIGISYPVSFPAIIGYNLFFASKNLDGVEDENLKKDCSKKDEILLK
jgi:hypothetical protein